MGKYWFFTKLYQVPLQLLSFTWIRYLMVIVGAAVLIFTYTLEMKTVNFIMQDQIILDNIPNVMYLINTSKCRIPDEDPFNVEIIDFIKEEKPYKCSKFDLLTYIKKTNDIVTLNVNKSILKAYSILPIWCCYSNITRSNISDDKIRYTACISFEDKIQLTYPYVRVKCYNKIKVVYTNVHATTVPVRTNVSSKAPKFSVMILGIDSMSKSSLKRNMPKTYQYLEHNMFNIKGFNKIGLNTFPNLMAILTGHNEEQLDTFCNRSVMVNTCRLIWDTFKAAGYITAYAEDECSLSTFNYLRPGFLSEPTDFYYHPYFIAAENLLVKKRFLMTYCAGPERSGDRLINAAKDFSISFKDVPTFGLFWTNSFSHDDINLPAVMDESIFKLLSDPQFVASLETTIFLFLSDHGFRFGNIRYTHSGWLEERLPFIYVHIPLKFQLLFPQKFNNFLINTERLTNNYDLYNTLQDILKIGNSYYKINVSQGCINCYSLFSEVPENRTCEDANIPENYCTCKGYTYISPQNPLVHSLSEFAVNEINALIKTLPEGELCSVYSLNVVRSAGVSKPYTYHHNQTAKHYLIMIETKPSAIFEATVETFVKNGQRQFTLIGDLVRLDKYGPVSKCIKNAEVKQYCYCLGYYTNYLKKMFSN